MLLTQSRTRHINTVTHEGKVLIVATVVELDFRAAMRQVLTRMLWLDLLEL